MTLRWLLFDVGGVLERVDDADWPRAWLRHWGERLGMSEDEMRERLAEADLPDTTVAEGTEPAYRAAFGRALGLTQQQNDLMFADMWDRYCGRANTELLGLARSLHGRVGLAILSNSADGARREEERRYGFSHLFDPILYSHEIGIEKPDPAVFELAAQRLGAEPGEILFIDNEPTSVATAARLGFRTVHHTDDAVTIAAVRAALAD